MSRLKKSFLALIILTLLLAVFLHYWDVIYGRIMAASFFSNLKNGHFQDASNDVYYSSQFNLGSDMRNANELWVNRVQDLKNRGTYIQNYQDLKVFHDDGEAVGKVTLSIMENGKSSNYSVIFYFNGNISNYGIARFEQVFDPGQTSEWQSAISGEI